MSADTVSPRGVKQAIQTTKHVRKVIAVGCGYVHRFYLLPGLVPCYRVCRLLAFLRQRFLSPTRPAFDFVYHTSGLPGVPSSSCPPLRAWHLTMNRSATSRTSHLRQRQTFCRALAPAKKGHRFRQVVSIRSHHKMLHTNKPFSRFRDNACVVVGVKHARHGFLQACRCFLDSGSPIVIAVS